MEKTLKTIREELIKQREEKKYSQEKVADFIEARVKELEAEGGLTHKSRP
jgi:DNA-binding XRE family transcriptional regulator